MDLPRESANSVIRSGPPVALASDSDVGLLVHLLLLLSLEVLILLLFVRLGPSAIRHLVVETSAEVIIGAPNRRTAIHEVCTSFVFLQFNDSTTMKPNSLFPFFPRRWRQFLLRDSNLASISKTLSSRSSVTVVPSQLEG